MSDLYIDPITRDYVLEDGRFQVDDDLTTQVYLCLETQRGTRIGDKDFGSRLHELTKNPQRSAEQAPALVKEALQPLFDEGLITDVVTVATAIEEGIVIDTTVTGPGGKPATFQSFREVGP